MVQSRVPKLTRFLLDWAADPKRIAVVRDANLAVLNTAVRDPAGLPRVIARSQGYGTWLCGSGQARVLAGDPGGWAEFRAGVAFMRAGVTLAFHTFRHTMRPGRAEPWVPLATAHAVALALALDDPKATDLAGLFVREWPAGYRLGTYEAFVQGVAAQAIGSAPTVSPGPPYSEILSSWQSATLASALMTALDYHVTRTSSRADDLAEFEDIPVLAFPAEVFAVLAVRRKQGLSGPRLDHPLLNTPLGLGWLGGVPVTPLTKDPLLESVQAVVDGAR